MRVLILEKLHFVLLVFKSVQVKIITFDNKSARQQKLPHILGIGRNFHSATLKLGHKENSDISYAQYKIQRIFHEYILKNKLVL